MYRNEIFLLVIYPVHTTEIEFSLLVISPYLQCSVVTIGNASRVSWMDWDQLLHYTIVQYGRYQLF